VLGTRTHRRPPTSCAHRLRKPDRTYEPLTLSVARRPRRLRAPPAPRRAPKGVPRTSSEDAVPGTPPRQTRWTRRWFRTTSTERTRAPSIGSRPDLAVRAGSTALVVHAHDLRPAPCRLLRTLAASSKAGGSLQAIPSPSRIASRLLALAAGKMRLPDFCNRPTTRAHNGLPDSRARFSSDLSALGASPTRPRPMASSGSPGGASLDGEPPASAASQPPSTAFGAGAPSAHQGGRCAVLAEPRSKAPPRCASRPRRFRPRAELAT
jgi:hypothetical protein